MKYELCRFGDLVVNFDRKRIPLSAKERAERQGGYRYYGAQGVIDYINDYLFDGRYMLIAEDGENLSSKKQNIAQIVEGRFWVNNHAHIVQCNDKCRLDYLEYAINSMDLSGYITGSAQPKLSQNNLNAVEIALPDLETQDAIISVIKPIDSKIEVNRAINHNLQQQARAIYREWFVDFAPNGGIMPTDWKLGRLKDILRLKRNAIRVGDEPLLPYLPIDVIPMNTFALTEFRPNAEAQSSLITFDTDDIVIGAMRVYFHRVVLAPCSGITRTTCFVLAPHDSDYFAFGLLCCDQDSTIDYAQTTSKGSTMPYAVWDGGLGDMEIVIPPREIAQKFNNIIKPMLRQIQASYFENLNLRNMRDSLLPKLMSGEIDVSEVEL